MPARLFISIFLACTTVAFHGAQAATIVVTTTADSGAGSLRAAVFQASNSSGPDDIVFQIPGPGEAGVHYIRLASPLPRLSGAQNGPFSHGDSTRVLGETQRQFGGDTNPLGPEIVLEGTNAGLNAIGLEVFAANCLIREIAIQKFDRFAIHLKGTNNKVEGCYIGTDANGMLANVGNGNTGIVAQGSGNIIGGPTEAARNIISGNGIGLSDGNGIHVDSPGGVTIEGNYIGLDRTGGQAAANKARGVKISGPNTIVRRNVISGHSGSGVTVEVGGSYSLIEGNLIGTNAAGTAALPNATGIVLDGGSFSDTALEGITVGGLTDAARNVISGNSFGGLTVAGRANGNSIQGNYIGTDITGMLALPNGRGGVYIDRGSNNLVGGTIPGARNVISGNNGTGLTISIGPFNRAQGNLIGVAADGQKPLGNTALGIFGGFGVIVGGGMSSEGDGSRNTIGGTEPGAGNIIAHNTDAGVAVLGTENSVLGNSIFNNGASDEGDIGIDLQANGLTPNDVGDLDGEDGMLFVANDYQNHPVITSVSFHEGNVSIAGKLDSTPNTTFRLEFFATDPLVSGQVSEGQTFLGVAHVATDGSGLAAFDVMLPVPSAEQVITATATDSSGNTSEFGGLRDRLLNISTRGRIRAEGDVLIAGFIITGQADKQVVIRGIGPSLTQAIPGALQDPWLELYEGNTLLQSNENWRATQRAEIEATGLAPTHDAESAIVRTLAPGVYTAVLRGQNNTTGIALIEAYDTRRGANSQQANISTRGFVGSGDDVMIGGFIIGGQSGRGTRIAARALGPSLSNFGISDVLMDPVIELTDANGEVITSNNDWTESQQTEIQAIGLAPGDSRESALLANLPAGNYTVIVRGNDNATGVGLVEVYNLPSD